MFLKPLLYRCIYRSQHTVPSPEKKLELRRRRRVRCSRAFAAGTDHEPRLRQRAVATATTVAAGAGLRATSAREGARLCKLFRLPYGYTTTRRRPPPLLFPASTTVSRHSAVAFTGLRLGIARFAFDRVADETTPGNSACIPDNPPSSPPSLSPHNPPSSPPSLPPPPPCDFEAMVCLISAFGLKDRDGFGAGDSDPTGTAYHQPLSGGKSELFQTHRDAALRRQTRARGAAAAAKTSTSTSTSRLVSSRLVSSRLVSSCRGRRARACAPASPRSLREGRFRTGSQSARRRRAAAKGAALASLNAADSGSSTCTAERGGAQRYTAEAASVDV